VRARQVIRRQAEHLTRLVDDLLDLTRVSRGRVELHRARVDLRDLVHRTAEDLRSLFEARGVALRVDPGPAPAWADVDPTRIAQVVGNLLQNAAKFTRAGGSVAATVAVRDGRAELEVRDDGIGIAPRDLERLFEPFAQAEAGLARSNGGLGLGLALVKGLVELHGGAVGASSAAPGAAPRSPSRSRSSRPRTRRPPPAARRPGGAAGACS
jgi:signal transduction histidine kinase